MTFCIYFFETYKTRDWNRPAVTHVWKWSAIAALKVLPLLDQEEAHRQPHVSPKQKQ
jgi:hypothetical protein